MASGSIRRVGVLTGGGDCPGLNAVIRAVVKTGIYQYGLEMVGIEDGYLGLIENRMHLMTPEEVSNILTVGGTVLGASNKADPASFAVREGDQWVKRDVTEQVLDHCQQWQLDALVIIGGDGTMAGAAGLIERGLRLVGVPKTIDNDLPETDMTFGHDTAVATATDALDKIHTTASSHHRVMVVEIMGRYAGWLALRAGVASGADVILIPEIPFDMDVVSHKCLQRSKRGKRFTIIAAGEGAHTAGGKMIVDHVDEASPDPIRLGGIARYVAEEVEKRTGLESRHIVLGHIQRGGTPTAFDRVLATMLAHHAVELLMEGRFGRLSVLRDGVVDSVPIEAIAGTIKTVPHDHPLVRAAKAVGTCFGDGDPST
ncbi:MAG TPA: ATP-dependent 6-phosphofructokinase [Phycisphaerae bacterium]|nr:ATP-dependent 6-phosphofructokinase [Phycisphaerae bacterium]